MVWQPRHLKEPDVCAGDECRGLGHCRDKTLLHDSTHTRRHRDWSASRSCQIVVGGSLLITRARQNRGNPPMEVFDETGAAPKYAYERPFCG